MDRDNIWLGDVQAHQVALSLNYFVDYNHEAGRLCWTNDPDHFRQLPCGIRQRVRPGKIIKCTRPGRQYEVMIGGVIRNALPLIWQHCTGVKRTVMTICPDETCFNVENLCLLPPGNSKAPKHRAKDKTVISWCYDRKKYSLVNVGHGYNRTILSYYDSVEDALNESVVSFM